MGMLNVSCIQITIALLVFTHTKSPIEASSQTNDTIQRCTAHERSALLTFRAGLSDPANRLSSWKGDDCCKWNGVRCSNTIGHVVKLDLQGPDCDNSDASMQVLGGNVSSSLIGLKHLQYLDLSCNRFDMVTIPEFLGSFRELRYLDLSLSSFFGRIPPQLVRTPHPRTSAAAVAGCSVLSSAPPCCRPLPRRLGASGQAPPPGSGSTEMDSTSGSSPSPSPAPSAQVPPASASVQGDPLNIDDRLRKAPLWRHVKLLEKNGSSGGNARSQCLYCNHNIPGSYSRVRAHLMREPGKGTSICGAATPEMIDQFRKEEEAARVAAQGSSRRSVPMPVQLSPSATGSRSSSKKKKHSGILQSFHIELRQMADAIIARMFYTGGVPFNLARNPNYREAFNFVATNDMGGYVPPGINKLRTTLLQQEKAHVEKLLEPIKSTWPTKGVTIAADGWTDSQRRPLLNFIAVTESGPMFLKCENTEGKTKTKDYISCLLIDVIEKVGPKNVVQVITDNAANCKAAGLIIEAKYSNIFWTPCVVHTLNLALKNICAAKNDEGENPELLWISNIASDALQIKNFIMNHGMRLSMFNSFSKLKFLAIADTRFASVIVMLKRFLLLKESLVQMVISDKWRTYREDDQEKAHFVRQKILEDNWWDQVKYIIDFTDPIYSMLRAADTDKPCLHLIYEMWDSMIEKVKSVIYRKEGKGPLDESEFFNVVNEILQDRWLKSNTPLHCLAHSLNPKYYSEQWLSEDPNRVAPHMDPEISEERNNCLRKLYTVAEELRKVKQQFADYSLKRGIFSLPDSIDDRAHFDPLQWWGIYGSRTPELKELAFRLLGQPASSSCCERNWSTYSFIHNLRRNKLTPERAEDLVFVHNNLRLLSRSSNEYLTGPSQMWDVGGDGFETFDGVGILQAANLTLDEPEFEVMIADGE